MHRRWELAAQADDAALVPAMRKHVTLVAYGRAEREPMAAVAPMVRGPDRAGEKSPARGWTWAALMQRAFALDVLACPHCGGWLRLIATLRDPAAIRNILGHLGRSPSGKNPGPAPPAS